MKSPTPSAYLSQRGRNTVVGSILVVEPDPALCHSRALLLSTLHLPLRTAAGYADVCRLAPCLPITLVALGLNPCQSQAEKVAAYVRQHWPRAKILLLGRLKGEFEDPLYDEIVDPRFNPAAVLDASKSLLDALRANSWVAK